MKQDTQNYFQPIEIPNEEIFTRCIHCGMCLAVCPTYDLTGLERSSPRGRIRLIKNVAEGELPITELFAEEMDFCLDCQACQTVCPAGVQFGQLVEASRAQISSAGKDRGRFAKRLFFRHIFPSHRRLKLLARLLRIYQKYFRAILHKTGLFRLLPQSLRKIEPLAPAVSRKFSDQILSKIMRPDGDVKYTVGFLKGCLMNTMFAGINQDTVDVLLANHCEVLMPKGQVCCGSLAAHNGDFEIAKKLARKNIDVFLAHKPDAVVINSAGCSAFMKEYDQLLKDDEQYCERAKILAGMTKDIHRFLIEIDYKKPDHAVIKKVTYHDACHLAHTQNILAEPRQIIQSIPGIEFVELNESTRCCGSAGIYNIVRYDDSMKILERKVNNIVQTDAEIVLAANPGCAVQIEYGLEHKGSKIKVMNPITLLNMAYQNSSDGEE
ncbi:MAG TPA: (Fe-S)-binding protein [Bacteroidetes bacterium]|nr:(Fe-S)-binding protein [Bacteroidota bacterium]